MDQVLGSVLTRDTRHLRFREGGRSLKEVKGWSEKVNLRESVEVALYRVRLRWSKGFSGKGGGHKR